MVKISFLSYDCSVIGSFPRQTANIYVLRYVFQGAPRRRDMLSVFVYTKIVSTVLQD